MQQTQAQLAEADIDRRSRARDQIVRLIEITYWLLIFEGAVRRWILPSLAQPLFFIRDPFVLYMYYLAWKNGLFPLTNVFLRISAGVAGIYFAVAGAQVLIGENALLTAVYGLRMYFFYVPYAFLCGYLLTGADLKRIVRRTFYVAIPMAVLIFFQYILPRNHPINSRMDGGVAFDYSGVARATGTFSFPQGHELFTHSLFCFLLATWLLPAKHRPLNGGWLVFCSLAVLVNIILDGNRGLFLLMGATLAFSAAYRLFTPGKRLSWTLFLPEILCAIGAVLYMTCFASGYEAMKSRIEVNHDGPGRIQGIFTTVVTGFGRTHLIGDGIGAGSLGGRVLLAKENLRTVTRSQRYFEEIEMGRIVEEAGPAGLFYIMLRYVLAVWISVTGFVVSRRSRNPFPFILASFSFVMLISGSMVLNGTSNGYAWIFIGFSIASNRLGLNEHTASPGRGLRA